MPENILSIVTPIIENGWIIALGVFVIAQIIKTSFPNFDAKNIPLIGGALGAVLGAAIPNIFPGQPLITCAIEGLFVGWAATGAFETYKNLKS